jgi:two-component system, OmpR family, response regulator
MKTIVLSCDPLLSDRIELLASAHNSVADTVTTQVMLDHYLSLFPYDLIIIDGNLPDLDILNYSKKLQSGQNSTLLLLLVEVLNSQIEIAALNAGADVCLMRSVDSEMLVAHVRALLRRKGEKYPVEGRWGDFWVNCLRQQVSYKDKIIPFTAKEYQFLTLFLMSPHQTFSAQRIIDQVWSSNLEQPSLETVKTHMRSLRVKLKKVGIENLIETVYGFGYRMNTDVLSSF